MNGLCGLPINFPKLSEILVDAFLTGVISALTILISYRLGKRQADINWKREIERKDKEIREQDQKLLANKQIDALNQLLEERAMLTKRSSYDYLHHGYHFLDIEEMHKIRSKVYLAISVFQDLDENDINIALNKLMEVTSWDLNIPNTESETAEKVKYRTSTIEDIFTVFVNKLLELGKKQIIK